MISVFLQGGLGNQLFQVAAAKSLALDLNDDFAINHDICYTPNQGQKSGKYKTTFFKNIKETKFIPNLLFHHKNQNNKYCQQLYFVWPIPYRQKRL